MRNFIAVLALFAFTCTSAPAFADSTADMMQMQKAFASIKSFHCDMQMPKGRTMAIDYVAPDKYHETLFNGMQVVGIGSNMWMNQGGKWMKLPAGMVPAQGIMDRMRNPGLQGKPSKDYTIKDLGPDMLGTVPAHHYRIVPKTHDSPVDMWVGMNHLPLQVQVGTSDGPMTILYSKYNAVADITPPM